MGCTCGTDTVECAQHWLSNGIGCGSIPVECSSIASCLTGQQCQVVPFGAGGANVGGLVLLCTAA